MMSEKEEDIGSTETGDQESRIQDIQEYKQDKRNAMTDDAFAKQIGDHAERG